LNRAVFLLSLAAFASSASLRATDPLLPLIADEYGVTAGAASAAITAFALSYGLLQVVVGPLGDRYGRYRTIAAAALVSAFGSAACGARGIVLLPGLHGFYGNDRRVWPIYEMAQSFQLPILAQSGDAGPLPPRGRGHWGRPRYFGDVAASFPKLRLILGHLGKGYESEIAVLTRRYPNVYTETSMRVSGLVEPFPVRAVLKRRCAESILFFHVLPPFSRK
jgi:hypothetical protein